MNKTTTTEKSSKSSVTMADLLKKYGSKVKGFSRSQKIDAKLIEINKKFALFDVNGKAEGVLRDIYFQEARDYLRTLKIGDTVSAIVMDPETRAGNVLLSLRHAAADSQWARLEEIKSKDGVVTVAVRNSNSSGISVDYEGINGFIPSSQIGKETFKNINNLGTNLRVKIVEIDKNRKKVVFSEKEVSEEKEIKEIEKIFAKIKAGEIYEGIVTTITNFGIFVEISLEKAKVEGLVHISESSWEKINRPEDEFKVGQKVKVKVLGFKDGKLSLSVKQAQDDPWKDVSDKFKVEMHVKGKVVKVSDFGSFVQIAPGIEGLVHITKIPPAMKLSVGDEVNCYIEEIDLKNKKISLGLVLSVIPVGYK